jgi:endonuclease/exonuclease/phosphatase family metal-dependent hydrolase
MTGGYEETGEWGRSELLSGAICMISVLTLNLRFGLAQDGPNGWEFRKDSLAELLGQYGAGFIGFQEANDFQIDYLGSTLADFSYIGRRSPAPPSWQSNVIFYRNDWQCIHRDHFFLSSTPDIPSRLPDSKWPRQCTVGVFQKGADRIVCINTHFDFAPTVQAESARIILDRISSLPADIPAILAGDFNAVPESPCYQVFTGKDPVRPAAARIFKDAFCSPHPATFHGFTGETGGEHIDWILYSGNIVPTSRTAVHQNFGGRYPSDHFPLFATFDFL